MQAKEVKEYWNWWPDWYHFDLQAILIIKRALHLVRNSYKPPFLQISILFFKIDKFKTFFHLILSCGFGKIILVTKIYMCAVKFV